MNELYSSPCSMTEDDLFPQGRQVPGASPVMLNISSSNTILYCHKWKECVHFYQQVLGFPVNFSREDWFREFRINAASCISVADVKRCTIASSEGVGLTLSWSVDELENLHANLQAQGVKLTEITSHSWRAPYFYAWDPEGNRIEFWRNFTPAKRKPKA